MKNIKELSLVVSGIILGIGLSFSPQIHAATTSLLGAKVDKVIQVKLDNKSVGQAIAINGVSYLPVRSLSNALDVQVNYNTSGVFLTSPSEGGAKVEDVPVVTEPAEPQTEVELTESEKNVIRNTLYKERSDLTVKIRQAKDALKNKESYANLVITLENNLNLMYKHNEVNPGMYSDETIKYNKEKYEAAKVLMSNYETNLPILEKELADLEAQLAALK